MAKTKRVKPSSKKKVTKQVPPKGLTIGILIIITLTIIAGIFLSNTSSSIVVLETSKGVIEIELFLEESPITTKNFISYVEEGFYDGLIFHRVIENFMIQGGGFEVTGEQKETKEPIFLESNNGLSNTKGTIAMARTNVPNSATSQFFINVADNKFLDYSSQSEGYAVFGKVVVGMNVIDSIKLVETTTKGSYANWPVQDVVIIKAYLK